ncbi:MAG TPA: Hsp20/alpha crystallin family protein [Thermoanaerobaculia bacterium]|nr:Hsp20/alpha crystallin family protein [Thermoanaerobaculia bacterium]
MAIKTDPAKTETVPVKHAADKPVKGDLAHAFHPWKMFEDFRDEMEEFWRGARNWPTFPNFPKLTTKAATAWLPSTDVYRTNGDLIVKADLPGLKKEDVEVLVEDGYLVVKGERKEEKEEKEKEYFRSERTYGSFYRRVPLPEEFDAEKISAKVHDGILEVKVPLPVTEAKEAKKIAVS